MSCRLPTYVVPVAYRLNYKSIDLTPGSNFVFSGVVEIDLVVAKATSKVTLHCLDLAVDEATLEGQKATSVSKNLKDETVTFYFDNDVPAGAAKMTIEFGGKLNNQMRGLYYSDYVNLRGEKRHLACTQFEATDARRAFPCWDEPAFKATFQVRRRRVCV